MVNSKEIPRNAVILDSIWALKRKRRPDGSLIKYKARLCVRGDQQVHGEAFWEVYAPVVGWPLVRILLILSILFSFRSRHVDFVNAFAQAKLTEPIYIRPPYGFHKTNGKVLLLRKSLYGLRQAARTWYLLLSSALRHLGFSVSEVGSCLFLRQNCAIIIYVDDMLIFAKNEEQIDKIIDYLRREFPLTDEGGAANYLGICIGKKEDGMTELKQPSSISKLLTLLKLSHNSKHSHTPAVKNENKQSNSGQKDFNWSYASAVGLLLWISGNARPDISFAVSSMARHMANPRPEHFRAVQRIGRYLLGTRDRGIILNPKSSTTPFEICVDADFAGNYRTDDSDVCTDSATVRSRTGYLLCFANSPLLWVSKLQGEVALSTTESEYIALSTSLRDGLPTQRVLNELANTFGFLEPKLVTLSCV